MLYCNFLKFILEFLSLEIYSALILFYLKYTDWE